MTGYTVHTGSNDKFRDGWDRVFKATPAAKSAGKKSGKEAASSKSQPKTKKKP